MIRKTVFFSVLIAIIFACEKDDEPISNPDSKLRISTVNYSDRYNTYFYDSLGIISELETHFNNDTNNIFRFQYHYNQTNQLVQIESKNKTSDMYRYTFTFTDSSIIELISKYQSSAWVEAYKHEYILNENNKCIKKVFFNTDLTTPSYYYRYTWSDENIIKEEEVSFASGLFYTKTFEYNDNLNPFYTTYANHVSSPHLQNKNTPTGYQKTSIWGDTFDDATYTYTLDEHGNISSVEFTDEYGDQSSYTIEYEEIH